MRDDLQKVKNALKTPSNMNEDSYKKHLEFSEHIIVGDSSSACGSSVTSDG